MLPERQHKRDVFVLNDAQDRPVYRIRIPLAFFQEYMDDSVKSVEDISRNLMVPALGVIPKLESLNSRRGYGYGHRYGYFYGYGDYGESEGATTAKQKKNGSKAGVDLVVHEKPTSLMSEPTAPFELHYYCRQGTRYQRRSWSLALFQAKAKQSLSLILRSL